MLRCTVCPDPLCGFRIHSAGPLGLPVQLPSRIRHPVVLVHGAPYSLGDICRMGRNLRRHDALLHILQIRQCQMLRRRHIAKEGCTVCRGNGTADGCGNMVIARRNVRHQRSESIEGRTLADGLLNLHIGRNLVHGHMSRSLNHHLHIPCPGALGQLSQGHQLLDLADVRGIRKAARPAGISQRDGHIVFPADLQNFIEMRKEGILLAGHAHPGEDQGAASGYNIHFPVSVPDLINGLPTDAAMQRHKVHAVLRMQTHHINEILGRQGIQIPLVMNHGIINRHRADHGRALRCQLPPEGDGIAVAGQVHDSIRTHVHRLHDLLHLHIIILHISGNSQIDIDLRPQHGADARRVQTFMILVGTDRNFAFGNQRHQLLHRHLLLLSHPLKLRRHNTLPGSLHLCCIISHSILLKFPDCGECAKRAEARAGKKL